MEIWICFDQDTSVVLERATVQKNVSSPCFEKLESTVDNKKNNRGIANRLLLHAKMHPYGFSLPG